MTDYRKIWENYIPPEIIKQVTAAHPYEVTYKKLVTYALALAKIQGKEIILPDGEN